MGAAEVRDEAERRLPHAELGIVGEDLQVAGQRELKARSDGVAVDRGHADESRVAQLRHGGNPTGQ